MDKKPLLGRIAFSLALLLPVYFAVAALGTKFGLWDYKFGLGTLLFQGAPILLGLTALLALIALGLAIFRKPRSGWIKPLIALIIPLAIFGYLGTVGQTAEANPIHDVSTDTANPPAFSEDTKDARRESGANPLSDYAVPLAKTDFWVDAPEPLASQSHAAIIGERYPDLGPILIKPGEEEKAIAAATSAMQAMGFTDIKPGTDGTVEGVDETFWFGFKDDVIARVANGRIDFRSVSRVGQSDLGANAKRIAELRAVVEAKLAE